MPDFDFRKNYTGPRPERGNRDVETTKLTDMTVFEALDARAAQDRRLEQSFRETIDMEMSEHGRDGLRPIEEVRAELIKYIKRTSGKAVGNLAWLTGELDHVLSTKELSSRSDEFTQDLWRVHQMCGAVMERIHKLAGRDYAPPQMRINTLELLDLGGWVVDPKTGARMDPIYDYRKPMEEN